MISGGFQKNSLIDFPQKIASVVFTQGCNFRCPYCHNPELTGFEPNENSNDATDFLSFLNLRKGLIEGVVITGGEPCLQKDIKDFIMEIKKMGFPVKLDTNGSRPEILEDIVQADILDFIAMDIKAPLKKYKNFTHEKDIKIKLQNSINIIMESKIDYLFRTTCAKPFVSKDNFLEIIEEIKGAKKYILQKFRRQKVLNPSFFEDISDMPIQELNYIQELASKYINDVQCI